MEEVRTPFLILENKHPREIDVVRTHFQKQKKKSIMGISSLFRMGRTDGS